MRRLVPAVLLALALSACATPPTPFAPANGPGGFGYSEQRIEQNRYRVTWRGVDHPMATADDLALLRAADLTVANGYDWFRVVNRSESAVAPAFGPPIAVSTASDFNGSAAAGFGIGASFPLGGKPLRSVTLEIQMEKGPAPHDPDAYDAHDTATTIRARI